MNPGHGTLCRNCRHFSASGWNEGHPNPCHRNRWVGTKHHAPALTADRRACHEFEAKPVKAKSSTKTEDISA